MARNEIIARLKLAGDEFSREFTAKFDEIEREGERRSSEAGRRSGGGFAKSFIGAAGLGALGAAVGAAISESAALGQEISNTSRQFGIGAEDLQVWRQAASSAGVSANELDGSLFGLTERISSAVSGNRDAQKGFVDLGISFETVSGRARATDSVMLDLAQRIAEIEDPAQRARVGVGLLGEDFEALYPLLLDGAKGIQDTRKEMEEFGVILTQEEIQSLDQINTDIQEMKDQLSRSVAKAVAENSDAILDFTNKLTSFSIAAIEAANDFLQFKGVLGEFDDRVSALPSDLSITELERAKQQIATEMGLGRETYFDDGNGLLVLRGSEVSRDESQWVRWTQRDRDDLARWFQEPEPAEERARPPRVTGSPRRSGSTRKTDEEREADRAAAAAVRAEEQLRSSLERTLRLQRDSAEVERTRAEYGEVAAAEAEAQLAFLRAHPLAVIETVDGLAQALGINEQLTEEKRAQLQLLIDQGDVAEANAVDVAGAEAQQKVDGEADRQRELNKRIAKQAADDFEREHERAVLDVADLYQSAMRGGIDEIWDYFEFEGTRIIAEIAGQWSLAMIGGQGFSLDKAAGNAFSRSPLSSIFFGATNDNPIARTSSGAGSSATSGLLKTGGGLPTTGGGFDATLTNPLSGLEGIGVSLALSQAGIALGGTGGVSGQIGGSLGGLAGTLVGGPVGALVGSTLGNLLAGALGGTKRGSVNIGGVNGSLGITGSRGNSSSREAAAGASAGSLIDAIYSIADQLGADVNAGAGAVSIGVRKDNFRVDTTGQGITKTSNGARDFGQDEGAAIEFAIRDLISDGVLTGLSQVSQNLLRNPNSDLETQIEKALLVEQVPRLLQERLDPLGAALDSVYDQFKDLADALKEGGASAQDFAEAQQLYELEKADAIASVGSASQLLVDFLDGLNAGSNSPLSLRQQRAEAEAQLAPFIEQITDAEEARAEFERLRNSGASASAIEDAEQAARAAAAAINQAGFTESSQLLLSISRQANASSGSFFSDFDRIRALTGEAVGLVDASTPTANDNRDPFSDQIARNTRDAAYILSDHTAILNGQTALMREIARGFGVSTEGFVGQGRAFTA